MARNRLKSFAGLFKGRRGLEGGQRPLPRAKHEKTSRWPLVPRHSRKGNHSGHRAAQAAGGAVGEEEIGAAAGAERADVDMVGRKACLSEHFLIGGFQVGGKAVWFFKDEIFRKGFAGKGGKLFDKI